MHDSGRLYGPRATSLAFLIVVALCSAPTWADDKTRADDQAQPAALELIAVDDAGERIRGARLELVLAAWGDHHLTTAVTAEAGSWRLVFDRDSLCGYWPERCRDLISAALLVTADGYASVMSDPFAWPGTTAFRLGQAMAINFPRAVADSTELVFELGDPARLQQTIELTLEPEQRRSLRLVDGAGEPLDGITVDSQMYISASNHCGVVVGRPIAERLATDADGRVELPGDDLLLGLQFGLTHATLDEAQRADRPMTWIGRLEADETTLGVHRHGRQPLDLQILFDDQPAAAVRLNSCLKACSCGACCGPVGVTDGDGRLQLDAFYPEEHSKLFILGERGTTLWQLPLPGEGTVELPAEPRPFVIYLGGVEKPAP